MNLRKTALWAACGLLLFVGSAGCGESERSRANRERNEQREAQMEGTGAPASATPSFMPATSVKLVILPGKVEIVQGSSGGPMILRVMVNAKQKVAFGVVPRNETGNYSGPAQVASAMEKLKCANSGVGTMSLSCELSENDKDMVIVVADMREGRATLDVFDAKKREEGASLGNEVSVDVFAAVPPKK